jgi:hypothetical protein
MRVRREEGGRCARRERGRGGGIRRVGGKIGDKRESRSVGGRGAWSESVGEQRRRADSRKRGE